MAAAALGLRPAARDHPLQPVEALRCADAAVVAAVAEAGAPVARMLVDVPVGNLQCIYKLSLRRDFGVHL